MANAARYQEIYQRSLADPSGFWGDAAKAIDWIVPPNSVFDPSIGVYGRWFPDAKVNTCFNAVDRHALAHPERTAIIYDSPITGSKRTISYAEFRDEVATLAAVLQDFGVKKGDCVIVYMPMIPEALFAMLACARIGAVH